MSERDKTVVFVWLVLLSFFLLLIWIRPPSPISDNQIANAVKAEIMREYISTLNLPFVEEAEKAKKEADLLKEAQAVQDAWNKLHGIATPAATPTATATAIPTPTPMRMPSVGTQPATKKK